MTVNKTKYKTVNKTEYKTGNITEVDLDRKFQTFQYSKHKSIYFLVSNSSDEPPANIIQYAENPLCVGRIKNISISTQANTVPKQPITVITLDSLGVENWTDDGDLREALSLAFYHQSMVHIVSSECRDFGGKFKIVTIFN